MSEHVTNEPVLHSTQELPYTPADLPYFPQAEWDQFKNDDIAAGKGVIILMTAIFTTGLILYSIVAIATGT